MTDRFFVFQKSLMDGIIADGTTADWYYNSLTLRIQNWDQLTTLQKTTKTTALTAAGFEFDHDA